MYAFDYIQGIIQWLGRRMAAVGRCSWVLSLFTRFGHKNIDSRVRSQLYRMGKTTVQVFVCLPSDIVRVLLEELIVTMERSREIVINKNGYIILFSDGSFLFHSWTWAVGCTASDKTYGRLIFFSVQKAKQYKPRTVLPQQSKS